MVFTKAFSENRKRIADAIETDPWTTVTKISASTGLSRNTVRKHIKAMVEGKIIETREVTTARGYKATGYALAGQIEQRPSVLFDRKTSVRPKKIRLHLTLDGTDSDEVGQVVYGRDYRHLPILNWHITMDIDHHIQELHDGQEHHIYYYDPGLDAWIGGTIFLRETVIDHAILSKDSTRMVYTYVLNGLGDPCTPTIEWMEV